ncbi:MAG TPA: DUF2064 domain-containing protein [Thermoanaerobaculia bacterium]|nr:DUF2064 domain-containing protein [Thermoanaerobaculia bacterium]
MARAVVIFGRSPSAEAASKQLRRAARLFEAVAASWIRDGNTGDARVLVACEPHHQPEFRALGAKRFIDQAGRSFGDRLAGAAAAAFRRAEIVLITGIDAPSPGRRQVELAFASIERGEVRAAVAPSSDGGINFIAMRAGDLRFLRSFEAGDPHLLLRCREWFGRELLELPAMSDIDSGAAVGRALTEHGWRRYRHLLQPASFLELDATTETFRLLTSPVSLRAPPPAPRP